MASPDGDATRAAVATADEVLDFWQDAGPRRWFRKDPAFDESFRARFFTTHEAAARGELSRWSDSPRGCLALLILLDQFPRNAFRDTARMFATDEAALAVARDAISRGHDLQVPQELRLFCYLPFTHSEALADQDECVRRVQPLGEDAVRWAHVHRDVIVRFGRFPHRNAILGRVTREEERAFLDAGGFAG